MRVGALAVLTHLLYAPRSPLSKESVSRGCTHNYRIIFVVPPNVRVNSIRVNFQRCHTLPAVLFYCGFFFFAQTNAVRLARVPLEVVGGGTKKSFFFFIFWYLMRQCRSSFFLIYIIYVPGIKEESYIVRNFMKYL